MTLPRLLTGTFFGYSLKTWLIVAVAFIASLSTFLYISDLNGQITLLLDSRAKLEKAMTKLQLDSIDISRRNLQEFAGQEPSYEKETDPADDVVIIYN